MSKKCSSCKKIHEIDLFFRKSKIFKTCNNCYLKRKKRNDIDFTQIKNVLKICERNFYKYNDKKFNKLSLELKTFTKKTLYFLYNKISTETRHTVFLNNNEKYITKKRLLRYNKLELLRRYYFFRKRKINFFLPSLTFVKFDFINTHDNNKLEIENFYNEIEAIHKTYKLFTNKNINKALKYSYIYPNKELNKYLNADVVNIIIDYVDDYKETEKNIRYFISQELEESNRTPDKLFNERYNLLDSINEINKGVEIILDLQ